MGGKRWQGELMQFLRNGAPVDQKNKKPLSKAAFRQVRQLSSNEAAPEVQLQQEASPQEIRQDAAHEEEFCRKKRNGKQKNESAGESGIFKRGNDLERDSRRACLPEEKKKIWLWE